MAFLMIDEAAACMTFSLWVSRSQILQDTGFLEISAIIVSLLKKKGRGTEGREPGVPGYSLSRNSLADAIADTRKLDLQNIGKSWGRKIGAQRKFRLNCLDT